MNRWATRWLGMVVLVILPGQIWAACTVAPVAPGAGFRSANGQLYSPSGQVFIAQGVNDLNLPGDYARLVQDFPGLNYVRVPLYTFDADPAQYAAAVQYLTSKGIVVEFEYHCNPTAGNGCSGGGQGVIFTDANGLLPQEQAVYTRFGNAFHTNPYVMYGTNNEPPASDPAALSVWMQTTYNTIRATGTTSPILFQVSGYNPQTINTGLTQSLFINDTNVGFDYHVYGGNSGFSTDQNTVNQILLGDNQGAQRIQTADGTPFVIDGEYGPSQADRFPLDPNGMDVVIAANTSGYGHVAWAATAGNADGLYNSDGSLSDFGSLVAKYMAAGGGACPPVISPDADFGESPTAPLIPAQPVFDAAAAINAQVVLQQQQVEALPTPPPVQPFVSTLPGVSIPGFNVPVTPFVSTLTPMSVNLLTLAPTIAPSPADEGLVQQINFVAGYIPMISPIGSFLVKMDAKTIVGMDTSIQGIVPMIAVPLGAAVLLFLAIRGLRIAQGDHTGFHNLPLNFLKIIIIIGLTTNIGNFDYYIRDAIYVNFSDALARGVGGTLALGGVTGVGSTLDNIWAQTWILVGTVWQNAGTLDVSSRLAAVICGFTVGICLLAVAAIYFLSRMLLAIVIVFGPICIACTLFDQTKPIFERWLGKCIALVILQVSCVVVMVMVFSVDQDFLAAIQPTVAPTGGIINWLTTPIVPVTPEVIQNLVSMVIWFGAGAFSIYSLQAIAYSIGAGVATNMTPVLLGMMSAAGAMVNGAFSAGASLASGIAGAASGGGGGGYGAAESYEMGFASEGIASTYPSEAPPSLALADSPTP